MVEKSNDHQIFDRPLSEQRIAKILVYHLQKLGYRAIIEFVVNNRFLDLEKLTGKNVSKVRIDVAAVKHNKIIFVEVENGFWMTHPLLYQNLANQVFLAYPAETEALTDEEQFKIAQKYGIGILKISSIGSITSILKSKEKQLPIEVQKALLALFNKRYNAIHKK